MPLLATYDPKRVIVAIGPAIISGFDEGAFIEAERSVDLFSDKTGADGFPVRSKSADKTGTVTLTLQQKSPSNSILTALAALDEASSLGVVPLLIKDLSDLSLVASPAAWIKRIPKFEREEKSKNTIWVFRCVDLFIVPLP